MDSLCREKGRRRIRAETNPYAPTAWCLRVLGNARENPGQGGYGPGSVDAEFMREDARLSSTSDGPVNAREFQS